VCCGFVAVELLPSPKSQEQALYWVERLLKPVGKPYTEPEKLKFAVGQVFGL